MRINSTLKYVPCTVLITISPEILKKLQCFNTLSLHCWIRFFAKSTYPNGGKKAGYKQVGWGIFPYITYLWLLLKKEMLNFIWQCNIFFWITDFFPPGGFKNEFKDLLHWNKLPRFPETFSWTDIPLLSNAFIATLQ